MGGQCESFGLLYCFALMIPDSFEQGLLAMQYAMSANIFACGAYDVFSNVTMPIAKGLETKKVESDLQCDKGGEFGTALNTDIFMQVWKAVIFTGEYRNHDWTVKADPDTVFLPQRLRPLLEKIPHNKKDGVYLNNCRMGMHGPLEVLSRNAVNTWGAGAYTCFKYFYKLCSGTCLWGEDMFLDQCLKRVLNVTRVNEYSLLIEEHCDPPKGWDDCTDPKGVSFHPFKKASQYKECLTNAQAVTANASSSSNHSRKNESRSSADEDASSKHASDETVAVSVIGGSDSSRPAS